MSEEDNRNRFDMFMKNALKGSTVKSPSANVHPYELAFAVEYLQIKSGDVKTEVTNNTPLAALMWKYGQMHDLDSIETLHKYKTDKKVRETIQGGLFLDQLLAASRVAGVDISKWISVLWRRFLTALVDPNVLLPADVSKDITTWIISQRCKTEAKFLKTASKPILQEIFAENAQFIPGDNKVLNSKEQLCGVIADLNVMARMKTDRVIEDCFKTMNKYVPSDLDIDDRRFDELRHEMRRFSALVDEWDDITQYKKFCTDEKSCTTNVKRLHVVAAFVKEHGKNCKNQLNTLRKKNLVRRRKAKDKDLGLMDRLRSYF